MVSLASGDPFDRHSCSGGGHDRRYHAEIYTANDVLIAGSDIQIEEFMPDRIDVMVQLSKPLDPFKRRTGCRHLSREFLSGRLQANRRYEVEFSVVRKVFRPKGFDGYDFTVKTENGAALLSNDLHEGTTDENGKTHRGIPGTSGMEGRRTAPG